MKNLYKLFLLSIAILASSCHARSQSASQDFKYQSAYNIHYTDSTLEIDELIGCDSLAVTVIITQTEVKVVINDEMKVFGNLGNLKDDPDVIKLLDHSGGKAVLRKYKIDGAPVWYFQGPATLIRLSNKKPRCAE